MIETFKSLCFALGFLFIIFAFLVAFSVAFFWIAEKFFSKKATKKHEEDVYQMYCDADGIKWGDGRW